MLLIYSPFDYNHYHFPAFPESRPDIYLTTTENYLRNNYKVFIFLNVIMPLT